LSVAAGERFWRRPLDTDSIKLPVGRLTILDDQCKGCGFCAEFCPKEVLVISARFNKKGYHPPDVAKPDDCVACRLCQLICPDFAIYVQVEGEEVDGANR
jgi:2-oxoglutarate ferredoxin oxidoreductase subunit delta